MENNNQYGPNVNPAGQMNQPPAAMNMAPQNAAPQFQPVAPPVENQKKSHKTLFIVLGVILGLVAAIVIVVSVIFASSKKMRCESSVGNITIMYNNQKVIGYAATGISYDLDEQQTYSEQIGINSYLNEFAEWFTDSTGGICER